MSEPVAARPEAFTAALRAGGLVFDGAMGTSLYERGNLYTVCFDELNLSRPEQVLSIHEGFVDAGAQVLETNTFGANRFRLERHGLDGKVREINRAGVALAREAGGPRTFVAGSVGPTGLILETLPGSWLKEIRAAFAEQCTALAEAG